MESVNKIHFLNSPYPNGHQLTAFIWRGRIDEDESVWFDFHLKSENYYAEEEEEENNDDFDESENEDISSWDSKIVWDNYLACTLSSIYWGEGGGIRIDNSGEKIDLDKVIQNDLYTNDLPSENDFDEDDLAFGIYLLGHDSCANHRIKFSKKENHSYDIEWTGKIALTYSGDDEFSHEFTASIKNAEFDGFHYPKTWSVEKATEVFQSKLAYFEDYEFVDLNPKSNKREYKLNKINK
ncbi:hypothetical protein [Chryseobacterium sp. BIGb0232]|uniref:hypothetical protein n=1 Tax=Chryseobacterium sp. BIGb0232 TaxID=2940598 RepID=UPI000F48BFAF|nr:hypothetical protein [Chryseobacterium sp. BIGb0232]MCS4301135.1 hypothetical protein [Chryseobacterium sp. BIGb0232]ROS20004.1 hypothetical protein EDF65_0705 [Chryseobacterium nakagawai]